MVGSARRALAAVFELDAGTRAGADTRPSFPASDDLLAGLEQHVAHWADLVPAAPPLRAALARALAMNFGLVPRDSPTCARRSAWTTLGSAGGLTSAHMVRQSPRCFGAGLARRCPPTAGPFRRCRPRCGVRPMGPPTGSTSLTTLFASASGARCRWAPSCSFRAIRATRCTSSSAGASRLASPTPTGLFSPRSRWAAARSSARWACSLVSRGPQRRARCATPSCCA